MDYLSEVIVEGITIANLFVSLFILLACLALAKGAKSACHRRLGAALKERSAEFKKSIGDLVDKNVFRFLYFISFYLAIKSLTLPETVGRMLDGAAVICLVFFSVRLAITLSESLLIAREDDKATKTKKQKLPKGATTLVKGGIFLFALLFLLDNLGLDITALVTGLGIGGIAVALASQAVLGDIISYFFILFDAPFEEGDYIAIGDDAGTVEKIGVRTTRIRSSSGEEIIIPNTDITQARVKNYRSRIRRRSLFTFGVSVDTPKEKVERIPAAIAKIIESISDVTFDRSSVVGFDDAGVEIETLYYVETPEYQIFKEARQSITLAIVEQLEQMDIKLAHPIQQIEISKEEG